MKIHVTIITKSKELVDFDIDDDREFFYFRNGLYYVDKTAVKLHTASHSEFDVTPELYYFEGNPIPIGSNVDVNALMEDVVLKNFLSEVSESKFNIDFIIAKLTRLVKNPIRLLEIIVAIVVIYYLIISFVGSLI